MKRGIYLQVGPKHIGAPRKERKMRSTEEKILDGFRRMTEENQAIALAYLAAILSEPTAFPSDRQKADAPTA